MGVLLRVCATAASLAAVVAGAALAAEPGQPPPGKTMLGVVGPNPSAFDRLTGHHHRLHLVFAGVGGGLDVLESDRAQGRITIVTLNGTGTPAGFARGDFDVPLAHTSRAANEFGAPVWIRPAPEMNGHWSPWCSVDRAGRTRGAAYSANAFRQAFRRIALIMRGGPVDTIDRRLRSEGMPPLRVGEGELPRSGQVAMLWNPQGEGSPNVAGNRPADYWPGPAYVDYVGIDLYEIRGRAYWPGMDALYNTYRKPFVIAEWAPWGYDSPEYVQQIFAWVAAHPRTVGLVYFNRGWSGGVGTFELRRKPRSLAAYRQAARAPRFNL